MFAFIDEAMNLLLYLPLCMVLLFWASYYSFRTRH